MQPCLFTIRSITRTVPDNESHVHGHPVEPISIVIILAINNRPIDQDVHLALCQ